MHCADQSTKPECSLVFVSVCEKCYPQFPEHENRTGGILPCQYCGSYDSKSIYADPQQVKKVASQKI